MKCDLAEIEEMSEIRVLTLQAIGREWITISIDDFRKLAPALAAHEAEWISSGKLRECIANWLRGADFSDPAMRPWEDAGQLTAKEELVALLREALPHVVDADQGKVPATVDLIARIRERLRLEDP